MPELLQTKGDALPTLLQMNGCGEPTPPATKPTDRLEMQVQGSVWP